MAVACAAAWGQTTVDLRTQTRNVDFSSSPSTKPFKTGAALPASCSPGEAFFKTDAPSGQNLYGCTAANQWTLEGGAGGGEYVEVTAENAGAGTTAGKLAKVIGNPPQAVIADPAENGGAIGIVVSGAGTGGTARIAVQGRAECIFDNAATAGDFVQVSQTVAGACHAAGPARTNTGRVVGRALETTSGPGSAPVLLGQSGSPAFSELAGTFSWMRLSDIQASISAGGFRFGKMVTPVNDTGLLTISGHPTGTVWVYAVPSGSIVVGHSLGSGTLTLTGAGYVVDASVADFPEASIPLYQCAVVQGAWGTCTDKRYPYGADPLTAGTSGALEVNCSRGNGCLVDVVPAVVPTKAGANDFTGLNTFAKLQIPRGPSLVEDDCDEDSEAGRLFINTGAPSGEQFCMCEGIAGWKTVAGGTTAGTVTIAAGPSNALSVDCAQGGACTVDVIAGVVPTKAGENDFTGRNTFASSLQIPRGTTLPASDCDEPAEAGRLFNNTAAPSGRQLFVCEGASGWMASAATGSGTVTSVALAAPDEFTVAGSPVTATGTLTLGKASQAANLVFAGPASGNAAAPAFRALAPADLPNYSADIGYLFSVPLNTSAGSQTVSATDNQVRVLGTFVDRKMTFSRIGFYSGAGQAGAVVRFGLYDVNGNRVMQTDAISVTTLGNKFASFAPAVIDPGFYYLAWSSSNSGVQINGTVPGTAVAAGLQASTRPLLGVAANSMGANGLPATLGSLISNTNMAVLAFMLGQ
jgi:hypothetical protein